MGAVRTSADTTPVHQLNQEKTNTASLPDEIRVHNIAFSSEEVTLSESGEKYAQIKHGKISPKEF